ncbi:MAG: type II toxin-antitoxin system prevent-host-death family antitoxin [Xanthomonadales bacterium]|nr:type II toxin-antitoxin system prevent-host-death family antitoxin [Xanthomonadales bacterium]
MQANTMRVNILEAKNQLSRLVKRVQSGEEVIIANRGVPAARLVPVDDPIATARADGDRAGFVDWLARHPLPAHVARDRQEIEQALRDEAAGWD